ncbi:hypothetical protein GGR57DRAFT_513854 [Xylariaceae sp. FL1272]|nr:hypothetical protein GGR57DRAFT_513854 [Xylariaceae sp. FL1272]
MPSAKTQVMALAAHEPCPHSNAPPVDECLDPSGDLFLVVGRNKCHQQPCSAITPLPPHHTRPCKFQVNAELLAGVSPSFGFMLLSPGLQYARRGSSEWVVTLPDDDTYAMMVVLLVAHHQTEGGVFTGQSPMDLKLMYDLARLVEKYDLGELLSPWVSRWFKELQTYWVGKKFNANNTEDAETMLYIAWAFGHEAIYAYFIITIAAQTGVDKTSRLADAAHEQIFTGDVNAVSVPPFAGFEIAHARTGLLTKIRADIKVTLEQHLHGGDGEVAERCQRHDDRDDVAWRKSILAWLAGNLLTLHLWPLPPAHFFMISPRALAESFARRPNIPAFKHIKINGKKSCHADGVFASRIDKIITTMNLNLSHTTLQELAKRADKSGLTEYLRLTGAAAQRGVWSLRSISRFIGFASRALEDVED